MEGRGGGGGGGGREKPQGLRVCHSSLVGRVYSGFGTSDKGLSQ